MKIKNIGQYKSWLVSAGIVLLIGLWLLTGAGGEEEGTPIMAAAEESAGGGEFSVRTRSQIAEEVVRTISVNGKTAPARSIEIKSETQGRVTEVGVERGERVSEGGIIVRLDERDRAARLEQARASVRQRQAEFEARERLKSESYVSETQLQEAAALLEGARAELKRAELDQEYMNISAPFDGALQERHVEVGDYLTPGDPVATFVDDRSIIVTAAVSEYDAKYVERGEEAKARLASGETISGIVRYVSPVADDATRTFTVELVAENDDGKLRAGMSAELLIPAERILAHKISPALLTLDSDGNVGVKTINDEGIVEFHEADIALSTNEGIWIAGLPIEATIITVGQGFVTEGSYAESVPEDDVDEAVATQTEKRGAR